MLVRTYRAGDLKQALAKVRAELGGHATVLSTRAVRTGLLSRDIEVLAALVPTTGIGATRSGEKSKQVAEPKPRQHGAPSVTRYLAPLRKELRSLRSEMDAVVGEHRDRERLFRTEISELRGELSQRAMRQTRGDHQGLVASLIEHFIESGMETSLAKALEQQIAAALPEDLDEAAHCVGGVALAIVRQQMACHQPLELAGERQVAALIGPPDGGKTTTLAKVAARAALLHDRKVAVVDASRGEASRGLKAAAAAIGIPWRRAETIDQIPHEVAALDHSDLVLVDASRFRIGDERAVCELAEALDRASAVAHLLLPADLRGAATARAAEAFSPVKPRSLSWTRIDCTSDYAELYNVSRQMALPTMYLCFGEQIPRDIEVATAERLSSLVVGLDLN